MGGAVIQVLPPGPKTAITCDDCGGSTFTLAREDGAVPTFHTTCATCGKRGAFMSRVTVTETRKFAQFADWPPKGGAK